MALRARIMVRLKSQIMDLQCRPAWAILNKRSRGRTDAKGSQTTRRLLAEVGAADTRPYLLHEPPARHCIRAGAAPRRTTGVALGHPAPGMGLCAISSHRELPAATCRRDCGHGRHAEPDHRGGAPSLYAPIHGFPAPPLPFRAFFLLSGR